MVMMRLGPVGMSQRTAGTQHDKRGINQHRAADNRKTVEGPTQSFHVSSPNEPFYLGSTTLSTIDTLVHDHLGAVYLRVLMHANACYTFDITPPGTEASHPVPQRTYGDPSLLYSLSPSDNL